MIILMEESLCGVPTSQEDDIRCTNKLRATNSMRHQMTCSKSNDEDSELSRSRTTSCGFVTSLEELRLTETNRNR